MVGDRLLTDVGLAHAAGAAGALVLTGATSAADVAASSVIPELVLARISDLIPPSDPLAPTEARP
jgi:ribonucleotide monophosphatase NagD (HAD superfamily)